MHIVILGGKLQGVEAVYLARKAGWRTTMIDRVPDVPAAGLCDTFIQADIRTPQDLDPCLQDADLMIPAMENGKTLAVLRKGSARFDIPVLFDFEAYDVSSSKRASHQLFDRCHIPSPIPWPACGFPLVVKPDRGSGSRGVRVFSGPEGFDEYAERPKRRPVIQQFLQGPQFSIEVAGCCGRYTALQTTALEVDATHDCKRVRAPADLAPQQVAAFQAIAETLARALRLKGLMDVEAVLHDNALKILEIDARFPSQTPSAVWWSSGINLLKLLADCFRNGQNFEKPVAGPGKGVVYEHIRVKENRLEVAGEHIMARAGALTLEKDFFGADEALTDFHKRRSTWVATLIHTEADSRTAWQKRCRTIDEIRRRFSLLHYVDAVPEAQAFQEGKNHHP